MPTQSFSEALIIQLDQRRARFGVRTSASSVEPSLETALTPPGLDAADGEDGHESGLYAEVRASTFAD